MFRPTSKVKLAAAIAAGALTLGAAGAYAATANNTITIDPTKSVSLSNGQTTLKLVALNGASTNLTLPTTKFTNQGQCVSWFATKHNYAVAPTSGTTVNKNYHGKLISTIKTFCAPLVTSTKTDTAETETPDATQSAAPETDSTDSQSGALHGNNGHGNGHGRHANETD